MGKYQELILERRGPLEQRIEQLKNELSDAYARLNALTHVERVPPEILQEIFLWVQKFCIKEADEYEEYFGWIPICRVCRRWREVALRCKELWVDVDIPGSLEFLEDALKYSGDQHFSISGPFREDRKKRAHSEDIKTLLTAMNRGNCMELSLQQEASDLPRSRQDPPLLLKAPNLQCLKLSWSDSDAHTFGQVRQYQKLVYLDLSGVDGQRTSLEFHELLETLQRLPKLQTFKASFEMWSSSEAALPVVDLPGLSYVELHGELFDCRSLLDHIIFPPHARLYISDAPEGYAYVHDELLEELRTVLGVARSNMERSEEHLSSVEIYMDGDLTFHIRRKTKPGQDKVHRLFEPDVTIEDTDWFVVRTTKKTDRLGVQWASVQDMSPMNTLPTMLRAVKEEGIQLADVPVLTISFEATEQWGKWEWASEKWTNILNWLRALRGVRTLHVSGWSFETISCTLAPTHDTTTLPLPALHTLHISDVDLEPCNLPQASLENHPASCFHRLCYVLSQRKAAGAAIAVLEIRSPSKLSDVELETLRGHVSERVVSHKSITQRSA